MNTLSDYQRKAFKAIAAKNGNVFLTGMAGTGKSYLIQKYIASLDPSDTTVAVCATTGIAALNLQDNVRRFCMRDIPAHTIYRWAGIGIGPQGDEDMGEFIRGFMENKSPNAFKARCRIQRTEQLIIDEISMLPGKILHLLDRLFRVVRGRFAEPFGGISIVVVGDFLQLPPPSRTGVYDWCFTTPTWKAAEFQSFYLQEIFRQSEREFIDILNDFRVGRVKGKCAEIIQRRIASFPSNKVVRLFTHNVQVDHWNDAKLSCLPGEEYSFTAETGGDASEASLLVKNIVTPQVLTLKEDARVMITANQVFGGELIAANGETGYVREIKPNIITVEKDNGDTLDVAKFRWHYDRRKSNTGYFEQFPLRPAYAMTIHKSQGLTLDAAVVDIRAARDPGQAYVAISRVKTLDGLWLKEAISGVFVSNEAIQLYKNLQAND